jgi:hypothetical protein
MKLLEQKYIFLIEIKLKKSDEKVKKLMFDNHFSPQNPQNL